MIITRLFGGLGNQMFQYALARRLSLQHNVDFKLDASQIGTYKIRRYCLNVFNIVENLATVEDILKYNGTGLAKLRKLSQRILPYYKRSVVKEKSFGFDPNVFNSPQNAYFIGFWQSERYFKEIEDIIRREFTFRFPPDSENERVARLINSVNAVSLHIRRGDYASCAVTNQFHGTCSIAYYEQAVGIVIRKITSPHFFVFSDDISWAKNNLKLKYPAEFISHNDSSRDFEDLRLMAQCRHHIIANSTFSWWGAWLNNKKDKIVIAPQKWFNNNDFDARDLLLKDWIRV